MRSWRSSTVHAAPECNRQRRRTGRLDAVVCAAVMSRSHQWVLWAAVSRKLCATCGLLWLRNVASNAAAGKPCKGRIDE